MSKRENKNKQSPLAIVGIGCLFPKADNPQEYWINIREGVDAITDIPDTHWNPADYFDENKSAADMTYAKRGGFINAQDFNPLLYGLSPNNIEATDTTQLLAMVATRQALLDANYSTAKDAGDGREFDRDRTSVIIGVTGALELVIPLGARLGHPIWRKALIDAGIDPETAEDIVQRIADSYVPWQENSFPGLLGNVAAGRIANRFDFGGTNCVVDAACASSLSALHLAAMELNSGRVDMAITGGVDTFNDIFMYMCFSKTPALSPTGNSRPFAKDGDGTILGEGIGTVILKRLDNAKRDNDKIYAILRGIGSSSDGRGNAIYAPSSAGQIKALQNAYKEADVTPRSIELVEAHGTGTSVGDAVEAKALSAVYSKDNEGETWCAIGSVKSMIGHTKAAAGVAGLIKIAMALKYKVLPPSIKVEQPLEIINPGIAPVYLNTVKRPWLKTQNTPRRAALSSFGFGGSNFHCVLEEIEKIKTEIEWDGHVLIIALYAESKEALIKQLPASSVLNSWNELRFFAYDSCQHFKNDAAHRLTIVIEKKYETKQKLIADIKKQLTSSSEAAWQRSDGVTYSSEKSNNNIAFVFPGQGSQYTGMCRDLACQFPQFLNVLEQANNIFIAATGKESLIDVLYPIPVFSKPDQRQQEEKLRRTQNAQPAIGAVSLAVLEVLNHFSVKPKLALGHSYGEITALSAAGVYSAETCYRISRIRGELMAAGEGDRGSMLAVVAAYEQVESLLKENNIELIIANHNSPDQVVLSGATDQVDDFAKVAKTEKIRAIKLPVAAAFHSSFVAHATEPFAEALAPFEFVKNNYQVLSNTTTNTYPKDSNAAKQLLANQLAMPVRFVEQIEKLYAEGITTFVEVGPGKTLTGLIKSILADKPITAIAVDASVGKKQGQYDLAFVLATLAAGGQQVELNRWDAACADIERPAKDTKPAMTIAINGANYTMPREPRPANKSKIKPVTNVNNDTSTKQVGQATTSVNTRNDLLQIAQESISALQKMQEQTARLHKQYLEGQETAQKSIQSLLDQLLTAPVQQAVHKSVRVEKKEELLKHELTKASPVIKETDETKQAVSVTGEHTGVDINNLLLKIVSEKTGYPIEGLELDMNMDSDLGIDSIKRVEILSALQEAMPELPAINSDELGQLESLRSITKLFVSEQAESTSLTKNVINDFADTLLEIVSDKTGYPVNMLSLEMSLDSDLGIDSIKRVEILSALQDKMPSLPAISADNLAVLQTLQQIIEHMNEQVSIDDKQTSVEVKIEEKAESKKESRIIRSIVDLTDIEQIEKRQQIEFNKNKEIWITKDSGDLSEKLTIALKKRGYKAKVVSNEQEINDGIGALIICAKAKANKQYLFDTFALVQRCADSLKKSKGLLVSLTSLGGSFGFEGSIEGNNFLQAGLCGIIKTADKEWSEVNCKLIDINKTSTSFDLISNELFLDGPLEVALFNGQARQLVLVRQELSENKHKSIALTQDDFIVISGGARGITAEVAVELADTYQCNLLLLGRSPYPKNEPEWLMSLSKATSIKKAIMDNSDEKLGSVELEKQYQSILANRKFITTLNRIEQAGSKIQYRSVDVTNADAVANIINLARIELGNVTGIIHAAGVLADRLIEDKTEEQFNTVYSTKVEGLQNMLAATKNDELKLIVLFSSTTARLGRKGQVDYAASNEILNKQAVFENLNRKNCKVLSVNWGPWDGGMVTPALKRLFEKEGVGIIGLKAGAEYLINEIESDGPVETVVLGESDNIFQKIPLSHDTSFLVENNELSLAFERELSVDTHPFLKSHVINNQAVLPVAVIIEWFAHGALHLNPGMQFIGFDNFSVLKGVILKADENIRLKILAGNIIHKDDIISVSVELRSDDVLHARAIMILADNYESNVLPRLNPVNEKYNKKRDEYYKNGQLFHGQDLQGIAEVTYCSSKGIVANVNAAPQPSSWMTQPIRSIWLTDPLIIDSAFQLMILWSFEEKGITSLPTKIASYRQYNRSYPRDNAKIVIAVNEQTDHRANAAIEFLDNNGELIALIDGYECVCDSSLQAAFNKNSLSMKAI